MGEEFYAIIKLVSGEEIFSLVISDEVNDETVIVLQSPVIINMFTSHEGSYLKVKPWVELSDEDFFIIKMDKIIYITESKDQKLINVYNDYISNPDEIDMKISNNRIKPDSSMGYISSVKDARKRLEDIFKGLKES
tara:strand:+ start:2307 stop:2714 length:408 start_codon:yes stop_codon:yes gene_type:complete